MQSLRAAILESDPAVAELLKKNPRRTKIALELRAARMSANLTQGQLAERSELTQAEITAMESLEGNTPNLTSLDKYMSACDRTLTLSFTESEAQGDRKGLVIEGALPTDPESSLSEP